jgi:hypothetical protein
MANFYATYSPSAASGAAVTAVITGPIGQGVMSGSVSVTIASDQTAIPVTGTFTNPSVGPTGAAVPADASYAGMNVGGNLIGVTGTSNGLKVDGSAVTQPISAAALPLPTGAATNAELVTINTTLGSPLQAGGTVSVSNFPATQPVSGTVTANAGTGNFTVTQSTGTNLHVVVDSAPTTAVTGTFFQATQPVSIAATVTTSDLADGSASGGTAGTKSMLGGGIYNSSAPTLTNGQQASLQLNASGALIVSSGATTTAAATFQDGSIAFGSLTTSFATVITTGGVMKHVDMRNGTNGVVVVSLNGGTTTSYTLDPGDYVSLDLASNGSNIASSTALQAKYSGTAPTSGSIRINGFY